MVKPLKKINNKYPLILIIKIILQFMFELLQVNHYF